MMVFASPDFRHGQQPNTSASCADVHDSIHSRRLQMVATFLLTLLFATSAPAQNPAPSDEDDWHFRFELFRMLLEQKNLEAVASPTEVLRRPNESVMVLMGNLNGVAPRAIEIFCERGGTVLMACDSEYPAGVICDFQAGPVTTRRSGDQYQGFDDCLKISNLDKDHPLMDRVGSLVVNRSGWLAKPGPRVKWDVLAHLPAGCSPSASATEALIAEVQISPSATGRLFIAADQSLFTNGMLWHGDNAILAINMSNLLCVGDRKYLLFATDGNFLPSYQNSPALNANSPPPQLPENLPEPELQTMLRIANSVIRNVEESNVINEALANRPRNLAPPYFKRGLLFALAVAVLLFVFWKLTSAAPTSHRTMPRREMKTAHALTTDRKVQSAEFGLAASMLARELCRELTDSQDTADWQRMLGGNAVSGASPIMKNAHRKRLAIVLNLAVNTRTVHISRRRFLSIGHTIQELRQLHQQNILLVGTG